MADKNKYPECDIVTLDSVTMGFEFDVASVGDDLHHAKETLYNDGKGYNTSFFTLLPADLENPQRVKRKIQRCIDVIEAGGFDCIFERKRLLSLTAPPNSSQDIIVTPERVAQYKAHAIELFTQLLQDDEALNGLIDEFKECSHNARARWGASPTEESIDKLAAYLKEHPHLFPTQFDNAFQQERIPILLLNPEQNQDDSLTTLDKQKQNYLPVYTTILDANNKLTAATEAMLFTLMAFQRLRAIEELEVETGLIQDYPLNYNAHQDLIEKGNDIAKYNRRQADDAKKILVSVTPRSHNNVIEILAGTYHLLHAYPHDPQRSVIRNNFDDAVAFEEAAMDYIRSQIDERYKPLILPDRPEIAPDAPTNASREIAPTPVNPSRPAEQVIADAQRVAEEALRAAPPYTYFKCYVYPSAGTHHIELLFYRSEQVGDNPHVIRMLQPPFRQSIPTGADLGCSTSLMEQVQDNILERRDGTGNLQFMPYYSRPGQEFVLRGDEFIPNARIINGQELGELTAEHGMYHLDLEYAPPFHRRTVRINLGIRLGTQQDGQYLEHRSQARCRANQVIRHIQQVHTQNWLISCQDAEHWLRQQHPGQWHSPAMENARVRYIDLDFPNQGDARLVLSTPATDGYPSSMWKTEINIERRIASSSETIRRQNATYIESDGNGGWREVQRQIQDNYVPINASYRHSFYIEDEEEATSRLVETAFGIKSRIEEEGRAGGTWVLRRNGGFGDIPASQRNQRPHDIDAAHFQYICDRSSRYIMEHRPVECMPRMEENNRLVISYGLRRTINGQLTDEVFFTDRDAARVGRDIILPHHSDPNYPSAMTATDIEMTPHAMELRVSLPIQANAYELADELTRRVQCEFQNYIQREYAAIRQMGPPEGPATAVTDAQGSPRRRASKVYHPRSFELALERAIDTALEQMQIPDAQTHIPEQRPSARGRRQTAR